MQDVDEILCYFEGSLRTLFKVYALGDGAIGDELNSTTLMSFGEWKEFCRDIRLLDADFTAREQSLAFIWCRMRVVDEERYESMTKIIQLSFEDFLDAIIHIATIKALPDDEQVYDYDCEDAGEFLIKMRGDPAGWQRFLASNTPDPDMPPSQPIHKLVEHLCHYIMHCVASVIASAGDARKSVKDMNNLTADNAKTFKKLAHKPRPRK